MTDTYEDRVRNEVRRIMVEFFDDGIDLLTVSEYLDEVGEYDETFLLDVYDAVNDEIELIAQRLDN